jgi:carbon storage regulator
MLVLCRKPGQQIRIDEEITCTVLEVNGGSVRVGIDAPARIPIAREELLSGPKANRSRRGGRKEDTVIISIRCHDPEIDQRFHNEILRKLQFALGRFTGVVRRARLYVSQSGPSAAQPEHRCHIVLEMMSDGQLCIEDADAAPDRAVDFAIERIGRAVDQELERRRVFPERTVCGPAVSVPGRKRIESSSSI